MSFVAISAVLCCCFKVMSVLLFFYCLCAFLCRCHCFNPSLCHLSPFLLSYVAVSRPCCLLEFYPNMGLIENEEMIITVHATMQLRKKAWKKKSAFHLHFWQSGKEILTMVMTSLFTHTCINQTKLLETKLKWNTIYFSITYLIARLGFMALLKHHPWANRPE